MVSTNRRSIMTLYSGATDPYSHRARIVLFEKNVTFDIVDVDASSKALEELASFNQYGSIPTLVDRDLVIYKSEIIMEYIDERFPHPPLMPVYPVAKARSRLTIHRINKDWYSLMDLILNSDESAKIIDKARKDLRDSLTTLVPVFAEMPFFLSEEFSLVDCCLAPLLWRLPKMDVILPAQAQPILNYADRIFKREAFQASLTDAERMMRS
jgi:RNA polymerase-associated protein